jgi:uncharacterized DUF497 family protein
VFSWDDAKNEANKQKHGVSFEAAQLVFDDPLHFSMQDRIEHGEQRWQTIGQVGVAVSSCFSSYIFGMKARVAPNAYGLFLRDARPN